MYLHKRTVHLSQCQKMSILADGLKIGVYLPLTTESLAACVTFDNKCLFAEQSNDFQPTSQSFFGIHQREDYFDEVKVLHNTHTHTLDLLKLA